jgi:valacyclovir hydrolase
VSQEPGFSVQGIEMAWFEYESHRLHYDVAGEGDPVLVLPGWGGTSDDVTVVRDALNSHFQTFAADLPGSGRSTPQPRTYTSTYLDRDADLLLAFLSEKVGSPAHVVGFSDGGEEALLMAEKAPHTIRSIVSWGSAGTVQVPEAVINAFATLVDSPVEGFQGFSEFMVGYYGEANARVMVTSLAATMRSISQAGGDISASRAAEIVCPTLLLTGSEDMLAPPSLVRQIAEAIPAGEFVEIEGAGHAAHHERDEWLASGIVSWLMER